MIQGVAVVIAYAAVVRYVNPVFDRHLPVNSKIDTLADAYSISDNQLGVIEGPTATDANLSVYGSVIPDTNGRVPFYDW
jgi:hypothetical protein